MGRSDSHSNDHDRTPKPAGTGSLTLTLSVRASFSWLSRLGKFLPATQPHTTTRSTDNWVASPDCDNPRLPISVWRRLANRALRAWLPGGLGSEFGTRLCPPLSPPRQPQDDMAPTLAAAAHGPQNRDLREAYLLAANLAGGKEGLVGYLKTQAELVNPSAFMTGLSKLLPSVLEGNPDAPLIVERVYYTRDGD